MERITVDALTPYSVSIKTEKCVTVDGVEYVIGEPHRCSYINSGSGRDSLEAEVSEPYLSAILAVWGDTPIVEEDAT